MNTAVFRIPNYNGDGTIQGLTVDAFLEKIKKALDVVLADENIISVTTNLPEDMHEWIADHGRFSALLAPGVSDVYYKPVEDLNDLLIEICDEVGTYMITYANDKKEGFDFSFIDCEDYVEIRRLKS